MMNWIPDFSTVLFARHASLAQYSADSWQLWRPALCFGISFPPSPGRRALAPNSHLPCHMQIRCLCSQRCAAAVLFSSEKPLLWKLLFPLSPPCHTSSPPARLSLRSQGLPWLRCPARSARWLLLGWGSQHCWRAANLPSSSCSSKHPLSTSGRPFAVRGDNLTSTAIPNCSQKKGKKQCKLEVPVILFC